MCMGCAHPAKFASTIAEALRLSETQVNAGCFYASPLLCLVSGLVAAFQTTSSCFCELVYLCSTDQTAQLIASRSHPSVVKTLEFVDSLQGGGLQAQCPRFYRNEQ